MDAKFPGVFFNTDIEDEEKATYVAQRLVDDDVFPPYVYVLLPDDHTNGTSAGKFTPEAMISDNDLVEDDPQIGADHVEYHRSYLLVMSPYTKHGYVHTCTRRFPRCFARSS